MSATAKVWKGNEQLRRLLAPIDELVLWPDNPRRGDVPLIAESLERFGQLQVAVVQKSSGQVAAGNHRIMAARSLGWTHFARVVEDLSDDEARRFLLVDNRSSDVGVYDDELLVAHLRELAELDDLAGTGYDASDLDDRLAALHRASQPPPDPADRLRPPPLDVREVVLNFSPDQFAQFETWAKIVSHEKGTHGISETCFVALEIAARQLNQG